MSILCTCSYVLLCSTVCFKALCRWWTTLLQAFQANSKLNQSKHHASCPVVLEFFALTHEVLRHREATDITSAGIQEGSLVTTANVHHSVDGNTSISTTHTSISTTHTSISTKPTSISITPTELHTPPESKALHCRKPGKLDHTCIAPRQHKLSGDYGMGVTREPADHAPTSSGDLLKGLPLSTTDTAGKPNGWLPGEDPEGQSCTSQPGEDPEGHSCTSQPGEDPEGHSCTSQPGEDPEGHSCTSQPGEDPEGHSCTSQPGEDPEGHSCTSQPGEDPEGHSCTLQPGEDPEGHSCTSQPGEDPEGHSCTSQPGEDPEGHSCTSQPGEDPEGHSCSSHRMESLQTLQATVMDSVEGMVDLLLALQSPLLLAKLLDILLKLLPMEGSKTHASLGPCVGRLFQSTVVREVMRETWRTQGCRSVSPAQEISNCTNVLSIASRKMVVFALHYTQVLLQLNGKIVSH